MLPLRVCLVRDSYDTIQYVVCTGSVPPPAGPRGGHVPLGGRASFQTQRHVEVRHHFGRGRATNLPELPQTSVLARFERFTSLSFDIL